MPQTRPQGTCFSFFFFFACIIRCVLFLNGRNLSVLPFSFFFLWAWTLFGQITKALFFALSSSVRFSSSYPFFCSVLSSFSFFFRVDDKRLNLKGSAASYWLQHLMLYYWYQYFISRFYVLSGWSGDLCSSWLSFFNISLTLVTDRCWKTAVRWPAHKKRVSWLHRKDSAEYSQTAKANDQRVECWQVEVSAGSKVGGKTIRWLEGQRSMGRRSRVEGQGSKG